MAAVAAARDRLAVTQMVGYRVTAVTAYHPVLQEPQHFTLAAAEAASDPVQVEQHQEELAEEGTNPDKTVLSTPAAEAAGTLRVMAVTAAPAS